MRIAVVVSTWAGHPPEHLSRLCQSFARHPAGMEYDLFLSANGLDYSPPSELLPLFAEIFVRENRGYNLGEWDHAWRHLPGYNRFLSLQDECRIKRAKWLSDFQLPLRFGPPVWPCG